MAGSRFPTRLSEVSNCVVLVDALARDLSAGLVVVPSTVPAAVLGALLIEEASRLG